MAKLNCDKKCNLFFIAIFFCFLFSFFWSRISGLLLLIFLSRFDESAEGTGGWGCWGWGSGVSNTHRIRDLEYVAGNAGRMKVVIRRTTPNYVTYLQRNHQDFSAYRFSAFRLPAFPVTYSSRMARVLKYQIPTPQQPHPPIPPAAPSPNSPSSPIPQFPQQPHPPIPPAAPSPNSPSSPIPQFPQQPHPPIPSASPSSIHKRSKSYH